jgi:hypothetical protein
LWVLLDSAGAIIDAGQQTGKQPPTDAQADSVQLSNARGVTLQVAIRRAAARP